MVSRIEYGYSKTERFFLFNPGAGKGGKCIRKVLLKYAEKLNVTRFQGIDGMQNWRIPLNIPFRVVHKK